MARKRPKETPIYIHITPVLVPGSPDMHDYHPDCECVCEPICVGRISTPETDVPVILVLHRQDLINVTLVSELNLPHRVITHHAITTATKIIPPPFTGDYGSLSE